jgi:hypothetical protein
LLGSVIAVGSVILVTQQATGPISGGYIHVGAARMAMPDNSFPSFTELLAVENEYNFGRGLVGYAVFAKRLVGSLLVPFFLACLVSAVCFGAENYTSTDRKRVWATFAIPIVLAAPLYLIAHDWGRFAGLAVVESVILLGLWRAAQAPKPNIDRVGVLAVTLLFAGIMTSAPALESYRINGLYGMDYRLAGTGVLFVVAIAVAYRRFWRTQLGL